jgi:hypothetical protein
MLKHEPAPAPLALRMETEQWPLKEPITVNY